MPIYLVQHGKAMPKDQDPEKNLSPEGAEEVREIAAKADGKIKVDRIEHSGKARAKSTAEIFADKLNPSSGVGSRDGLGPKDDVAVVADTLDSSQNLMLVGHLPFMERLAGLLITGSPDKTAVKFQNGGILCLDREPGADNWHVKWTLFPSL